MAPSPKSVNTTIETDADIRAGVTSLRRRCPHMRRIHDRVGDPPLRRHTAGFEGLARIIVGQQVSAASADAIWRRTAAAIVPFQPERLLDMDDDGLRAAGLSRPKVRTLRALSEALVEGRLVLEPLQHADDEQVRAALTSINGIGPWTADIYLMFCLGRTDSWASGDLALQLAAWRALKLKVKPDARRLETIAERWRPWRGVAARLLWAFYAAEAQAWSAARSGEKT
jgi:DNA-3-methyladenine glycosylase II